VICPELLPKHKLYTNYIFYYKQISLSSYICSFFYDIVNLVSKFSPSLEFLPLRSEIIQSLDLQHKLLSEVQCVDNDGACKRTQKPSSTDTVQLVPSEPVWKNGGETLWTTRMKAIAM